MPELKGHILSITLCVLLAGCIPEEDPIAPYDRGSAAQAEVELGSDYRYQVFFDVEMNSVVGTNEITGWDLGFRCDPDGHHIVLNSAKIMSVADMGPVEFESVTSKNGLVWNYDRPSGEWDSTAIGRWWNEDEASVVTKGHVYVLDRGYGPDARAIGYAKMTILSATASSYIVRTATLDNRDDRTSEIPRDTSRNVMGLSLDSGSPVNVEPPKDAWDLLFTRYTHLFHDPEFTPYSVTGILLNRYRTEAAVDRIRTFEEISSEAIDSYEYGSRLDLIGYDWKTFDLQSGTYTMHSPVYLLKDSRGFYYKLRLLDFYNGSGEKGYPRIESQKL